MEVLSFVVLSLLGLTCVSSAKPAIRGLNPELADRYKNVGNKFTCIDGSFSIPFSQVNDNYCDCADGSDEPGTPACHNGIFYCRNKGHEPRLLPAQFVDDGVCDCCDGSDEPSGCPYKCLEKSAAEKESLKAEITALEQALAKKEELKQQAKTKRVEMTQRLKTIDSEIEAQRETVRVAQEEKARLQKEDDERRAQEAAERAQREAEEKERLEQEEKRQQELQAQMQAEAAANAEAAAKAEAEAAVNAEAAGSAETVPTPESVLEVDTPEQEGTARELLEEHHTQEQEHIETDEERGRRIASQWTHDPEAADGAPAEEHAGHYDIEPQWDADAHHEYDHEHEYPTEPDADIPIPQYQATPTPTYNHELQNAIRKAGDEERKLQDLIKEKENMGRYINYEFGPGEMYLPLAGKCIEHKGTRWTYEACWFGNAYQKEGYSNTVNLGVWNGFQDNYSFALFGNGDFCGAISAPRSLRLELQCSLSEELYDCEEPATCAYACKFTTPTACTEQDLKDAKDALLAVERAEAEILAELAAEAAGTAHDEL